MRAPARTTARRHPRRLLRDLFTAMHRPRVLLAEDDAELRALLVLALGDAGYDVVEAANGVELWCWLEAGARFEHRRHAFDAVVTDLRMPGRTGLEVLEQMRPRELHTQIILISAFADDEVRSAAQRHGVAAVLAKPFALGELIEAVKAIAPPLAA